MKVFRIIIFSFIVSFVFGQLSIGMESREKKMSEIIGSSHVIPRYYFGDQDCLNQGADTLLEMGSEVIKIWYYNGSETPDVMYPWNSNWTKAKSLVEGLDNTHYTELFDKPFHSCPR